MLSPVYVVASGLPQPGDWLVLVLTPLVLARWNGRLDRANSQVIKALLVFTLWVCVVNYGWAFVLGKWGGKDFTLHPFFYIFNAAVFLSAIVLARRNPERFLRITVDLVFLTIIASLIGAFLIPGLYRTQSFFNSPNQLGYYALLSACLFSIVHRPLGLSRLRSSTGIAICGYLAFVSASRASLAGILLLLLVLFFSDPKIIIIGALAAIGIVNLGGPISETLEFNEKRAFEDRDPNESFAEERGYDRIWRFPQHLIVGAGEGDYQRFAKAGKHKRELHSSFGSVLFGYGIIGVTMFLLFFYRALRGIPRRAFFMLTPALIYTVAHQGLRFTMFWVVLAAVVVLKSLPEKPVARVSANS